MMTPSHVSACHGAHEPGADEPLGHICDLIRSEYHELPCLSLTLPQAIRLWGLDHDLCETALASLVTEGFLQVTGDGMYRLSTLA
jgi:hypothetical protein